MTAWPDNDPLTPEQIDLHRRLTEPVEHKLEGIGTDRWVALADAQLRQKILLTNQAWVRRWRLRIWRVRYLCRRAGDRLRHLRVPFWGESVASRERTVRVEEALREIEAQLRALELQEKEPPA